MDTDTHTARLADGTEEPCDCEVGVDHGRPVELIHGLNDAQGAAEPTDRFVGTASEPVEELFD